MIDYKELMDKAIIARENAYAPYSNYKVGAALLTKNKKIYTGCNMENASFGATICAERVAIGKAISDGEREFSAIAIVGARADEISGFAPPCGVCLQVMSEFCGKDFKIVLVQDGTQKIYTLAELLPNGFKL